MSRSSFPFDLKANGTAGKAVMVNIHGGGHAGGIAMDAFTGPDFLLFHGNIVVKFGYRVEKFGFLSLGYGEYTGNMALKDQQLALKWIHENIKNFGGNTEQILLFGGSSGKQMLFSLTFTFEIPASNAIFHL